MGLDQYLTLVNTKTNTRISIPGAVPPPKEKVVTIIVGNGEFKSSQQEPKPNTYRNYDSLHEYVAALWEKIHPDQEFNCIEMAINVNDLDKWFKSQDTDWDTPTRIDYRNPTAADYKLSDTVFYRDYNHAIIHLAQAFSLKGFQLCYSAWY